MNPKADNLFHFTKNIDVVKSILSHGFYPRYCLEDTDYLRLDTKYIAYPIICFCDIPLSRISDHTSFYGEYGFGLSKEWGLKNNLNPVLYTPQNGILPIHLKRLFDLRKEQKEDENLEELKTEIGSTYLDIIPLVKPTNGKMVIGGNVIEKEFYQENEWRFILRNQDVQIFIPHNSYENEKEEKNKDVEKYKLEFSPSDIRYIFVKRDHEIPGIIDHINTNLSRFPLNDIKILTSRITSLETIAGDI